MKEKRTFRVRDEFAFDGVRRVGFTMYFENGITVSVQWGDVNYCDQGVSTAEVAVWHDDDTWFTLDNEGKLTRVEDGTDVISHCTTELVANIINQASTL